jgi:phage major head subunit gpT-like protein
MSVEQMVKALDSNIKTTFKTFKEKAEDKLINKLYDITPVTGSKANIVTLVDVPGMREWKSERVPGTVSAIAQSLRPRKWEQTLAIKRENIEDDEIGWVPAATRRMAIKSKLHYSTLAILAVMQGFTTKTDDGANFISSAHKNLATGALTGGNLDAAALLMMEQEVPETKDKESLGAMPTILLVGPKNFAAAKQIIAAQQIDGTTNVHYEQFELIVHPAIRDLSWYLIDGDEGIFPITIAQRRAVGNLLSKTDLNSDKAFDRDIFEWGSDGRYDPAYQNYQLIVGSVGA